MTAQVIGAVAAAAVLHQIGSGHPGFDAATSGFAVKGYGEHSPGQFSIGNAALTAVLFIKIFVIVIQGVADKRSAVGFAPLAIALCLTPGHLISIPVTNTSVYPARSTGWRFFSDGLSGGRGSSVCPRWYEEPGNVIYRTQLANDQETIHFEATVDAGK
jgi:aquaporin Z